NGFVPSVGNVFTIMTYASHTGIFQNVTGLVFGTSMFQVNYNATSVTLSVVGYSTGSAPSVTAVSPTSGSCAGGTSVTVTGTNFSGVTGVFFGGTPVSSFTVNSSTSI